MPACGACGLEFTDEELSAYLDRVLCRKCYPKAPSLKALRETSQHSPYMAFALSILLPGGGHVYAGAVGLGYVLNVVVNGTVAVACLAAIRVSPRAFLVALLGVAAVVPVAAILIGGHAVKLSQAVRRGERPPPASLRPLWIFLAAGVASLLAVAVVLVASLVYVGVNAGQLVADGSSAAGVRDQRPLKCGMHAGLLQCITSNARESTQATIGSPSCPMATDG